GQGTLAAAVAVRLSSLALDGSVNVLVNVNVDAHGKFTANLPLGLDLVVAEALDVSGNVLGSALVGATGTVNGGVVVSAPITAETSLEVKVLLGALGCHCVADRHGLLSLSLDVAALIDA